MRLASLWNRKAFLWLEGRKNWRSRVQETLPPRGQGKRVWIHCASLGEFEQGRPVIEAIRSSHPGVQIILTFFSPSGFEIRKNYALTDGVYYLPADTRTNARDFLELIQPDLVIFVKYEYWINFITEISRRKIPFLLISAIFLPNQVFFKWYGRWFRKMLQKVDHIFVQDEESRRLLSDLNIRQVEVSGDTRYDRVHRILEEFKPDALIEQFCVGQFTLVAGSTWPADERLLSAFSAAHPKVRLIIAPHEVGEVQLRQLRSQFPDNCLYSKMLQGEKTDMANTLIIDNMGMLAKIYRYGHLCYVGGGFGKGIHNILEPAAHGKPVIFGPRHQLFREASDMIAAGCGFSVADADAFIGLVEQFIKDEANRMKLADDAARFILQRTGATQRIMQYLNEHYLLDS